VKEIKTLLEQLLIKMDDLTKAVKDLQAQAKQQDKEEWKEK